MTLGHLEFFRKSRSTTSINDTEGKFAAGVNYIGGKFATGIFHSGMRVGGVLKNTPYRNGNNFICKPRLLIFLTLTLPSKVFIFILGCLFK